MKTGLKNNDIRKNNLQELDNTYINIDIKET